MKQTKDYFKISDLFYKYQSGLISDSELSFLKAWRDESRENLDTYNRQTSDLNIDIKQAAYREIDSDKAWEKLQPNIKVSQAKGRQLALNFLRYAAVILLPLAIGGMLVFQALNQANDFSETIVDQVTPGTHKASLVLSNGEIIDLTKRKDTLIAGQLLNHNKTLTYQADAKKRDQNASQWHKLIIPVGEEYHLQLADGTKVWLNSDSELKYTNQFVGKQRIVYLKGEAYFDVSEDKQHPFIVRTQNMDVKVYGTEFNVMAYADEEICSTTLVEGHVGVDLKNEAGLLQSAELKPDMQMEYARGDVKGKVNYVDASLYTGWKDGIFQFNNEDLGSILRKLSRWYDVKFFCQNPQVQNIQFSGEMKRFDDFATILNLLELGSGVHFELKGKVVIVRSIN